MLNKHRLLLLTATVALFVARSVLANVATDTIRAAQCPPNVVQVMSEPDGNPAWFRVVRDWSKETPGAWSNDSLRRELQTLYEKDQMVGAVGANAAFGLVQHSDELRPEGLALMQAAKPGEVMPSDLALMIDRQRTTGGRPQVYGSQVDILTNGVLPFFPVEDPQHVDERRLRAGLPPLRIYACVMATMYKAAVVLPPGVPIEIESATTTP